MRRDALLLRGGGGELFDVFGQLERCCGHSGFTLYELVAPW
jgi:hypothetical protein